MLTGFPNDVDHEMIGRDIVFASIVTSDQIQMKMKDA